MFSTLFYVIVAILLFDFIVEQVLASLNFRALSLPIPSELEGLYEEDKYRESVRYQQHKSKFGFWSSLVSLMATLLFLSLGGFAWADSVAGSLVGFGSGTESASSLVSSGTMAVSGAVSGAVSSWPMVGQGLAFFGIIGLLVWALGIPFALYETFVVEQKFGFNRMTPKTFWLDQVKGLLLGALVGGLLMGLIMLFYYSVGQYFWIYAWLLVAVVQVFLMMFYSTLIVPLFNKQEPLQDGELKQAIREMTERVGFKLDNVYVIDGSKRSTKANAYFSGLGPKKRIVLYDTLIKELTTKQIVAVLAHEIGHYKHKHVLKGAFAGILQVGLMFFLLSLCLRWPALSEALGVPSSQFLVPGSGLAPAGAVHGSGFGVLGLGFMPPFHIGLVAFGMLYSPVSALLGLFMFSLSRRHEYQADRFAAEHSDGEELIGALWKLSATNFSHLTPHPWYVFVHYSHPTLLQRMRAFRS